jgi:predicted O-methyltransferase YrrM
MPRASDKEIKAALDKAFQIRGLFGRKEAALLYRLAQLKGYIVEIGAWHGRSTAVLVQAAKAWKAKVITVEPFGKERMPERYKKQEATAEKWWADLKHVGLEPPMLLAMTSDAALPQIPKVLSLVFIDGDHSYGQVKRDLENYASRVRWGGYVFLHDMTYPTTPGVAQAVNEWLDPKKWEKVGEAQYSIAFRRLKDG